MMTLDDYKNDASIINDPMPLREVHAIRLMIYDSIKAMTPAERTQYYNESINDAQRKYGFKFKVVDSASK